MRLKNRAPPLALLLLALVLALGTLGVAYTLWSGSLYINGTVKTGNVDAEWDFVGCFDIEGKDVGTTAGAIDGSNPHILHFTIDNGYPSYTGDCQVELHYTGTVPAHVESIDFVPGPELTNCVVDQDASTGSFVATCDQLTVTWVDGLCTQLHQSSHLASSLRVHVEQDAEMSSQYTFGVSVLLVQYNESACP
jgi:hypothetical protein